MKHEAVMKDEAKQAEIEGLAEDQEIEQEDPEQDEGEGGQQAEPEPQPDPEAEEEARKYGWKPKGEFDRNPEGWVDAERFLQLPATIVKMQRDSVRELKKALAERDDRLARVETTMKTAAQRIREQERARFESQVEQLERAKREAAEVGDMARYDQALQAQRNLTPPKDMPDVPANNAGGVAPEIAAIMQTPDGAWMQNGDALRFAASEIDRNPAIMAMPPLKQVQWARSRVREIFPELFPEQPQAMAQSAPRVSRVDGGGIGGGMRSGKSAADLPPEARKAAQMFVEEGVYKSADEYAKEYFAQEAGQ